MKNSTSYSVDSLFKGLRNLLASLPTEEEKLELIQTLAGARQFLEDMTSLIEAFPTIESTEELSQGMTRLDILVDRAANHAPLRKLIGLKSPQTRKIKNINPVEDIASRALRVEERLRHTDSSEIVGLLERSGEPVSVLIEVATHLGYGRVRKSERLS